MPQPSRARLVAAFAAGLTAWEAVVHASLLLDRVSPRLFGIRLSPRLNAVQAVLPAVTSAALAGYAFSRGDRPPFLFRVAARRVLTRDLDTRMGAVLRNADRHYAALAPKIAQAATASGRLNLRMSAYLLALFRAMRDEGIADERATALLNNGLFRVMRWVWQMPDAVVRRRYPHDRIARVRARQRIARSLYFREPDWVMREVTVDRGFGVDITHCVMRDFFAGEGALRFCEDVMCRQDALMAELRGQRFRRTTTLAGGGERCDFRFS